MKRREGTIYRAKRGEPMFAVIFIDADGACCVSGNVTRESGAASVARCNAYRERVGDACRYVLLPASPRVMDWHG